MRRLTTFSLVAFLFMQTLPISVSAQQETNVFSLPVAQAMALYQVNLQQLLRDNYKLKLESTSETQNFRWYFQSGALPFGLRINADGNIVGRPRTARAEPYVFKLKVSDPGVGSDALILTFQLKVEATSIRLVSTNPPRLVPTGVDAEAVDRSGGGQTSFSHPTLLTSNSDPTVTRVATNALTFGADINTGRSLTNRRGLELPPRAFAAETNSSANTNFTATASRPSRIESASAVAPPALPVDDPSCPGCLPSPRPAEKTDFIINARTGETSGKKKFGLHDNARIIVTEKNPFLYEYRVTLKDKPIVESAIAEFFKGWPLFVDHLDPKPDADVAAAAAPPCPQLDDALQKLSSLQDFLARADSATNPSSLRNRYQAEQKEYESVAHQADSARKVLYDQNASCSSVCETATGIRSTLGGYKPDLEKLTGDISLFKSGAATFQGEVAQLQAAVRSSKPALPNACSNVLDLMSTLATGYMKTAGDLEAGIEKMTAGKKAFDGIVKTIDNVFASPNAFYQVYTRGEYSLPTDVEITVERKDLTKDDATFAKVVDAATLNFGGGARFAIAGGVVVSPFETINFKRVPALVGGQPVTIVGKDEGSNSRILPILMLHGRLLNGKGPVSGVHMSLGVTAKPDDKGTNVEFLVGPSISFIEERLFLTFGGYAGRQKQLEGNLVLGQQLPKEFTDDIPTSNHLVWKPGFALTYKFK